MSAHRYTMARMKNKINETQNVHTVCSMICGHDKSAPYSGCLQGHGTELKFSRVSAKFLTREKFSGNG